MQLAVECVSSFCRPLHYAAFACLHPTAWPVAAMYQLALSSHRCEQGALALQSSERCSISRRVSLRLQLISDVEDVLADGISTVDADC
jgi:hypothetical protein